LNLLYRYVLEYGRRLHDRDVEKLGILDIENDGYIEGDFWMDEEEEEEEEEDAGDGEGVLGEVGEDEYINYD
jgi:hypothetical protein